MRGMGRCLGPQEGESGGGRGSTRGWDRSRSWGVGCSPGCLHSHPRTLGSLWMRLGQGKGVFSSVPQKDGASDLEGWW